MAGIRGAAQPEKHPKPADPLQTDAHPLRVIEDFAAKVKCRGNAPDRRAKAYALNEAVHAYESGFNVFSIDVGRGHDVLFMD